MKNPQKFAMYFFDFSHVDRVLAAINKTGIKVIVGTPAYAIPEHPDVLVITPRGLTGGHGRALGEELASSSSFSAGGLNWRRFVIAVIDFVRL